MQRDIEINLALEALGYKVIRFWENQIKKEFDLCVQMVLDQLML